jgi:uncharacterized protein YdhG (YjbR/CyaY superfamily)
VAGKFATIDDYIASLPEDVQGIVEEIRRRARRAAPEAEETISYNMPTLKGGPGRHLLRRLKTHIAVYPGSAD